MRGKRFDHMDLLFWGRLVSLFPVPSQFHSGTPSMSVKYQLPVQMSLATLTQNSRSCLTATLKGCNILKVIIGG
jgi:hypothetical protein